MCIQASLYIRGYWVATSALIDSRLTVYTSSFKILVNCIQVLYSLGFSGKTTLVLIDSSIETTMSLCRHCSSYWILVSYIQVLGLVVYTLLY
jgi:hypothetical protein